MARRQLITSDQAIPTTGQHKQACSDCPWSRASLPGWLGGNSAQEWIGFAHTETYIPCHVLDGAECAGAAVYRANVSKLPRPGLLRLPADRKAVFATPVEFLEHHKMKTIT